MNKKQAHIPKISDVQIKDGFWGFYKKIVKDVVIPYQWKVFNNQMPGVEPSYCIENLQLAAKKNRTGTIDQEFHGIVYQDSDLAKWIEAAACQMAQDPDEDLEKTVDGVINLIGQAQEKDGYLETYYTVKHPDRKWTNLRDGHELYCSGHLIEAAVAYYEATGKRAFLDIMERNVENIMSVFGKGPGKIPGYPGHPEIELALIRLYHATGKSKYLDLAEYFIRERGQEPNYFITEAKRREGDHYAAQTYIRPALAYCQADKPVTEQKSIRGHAVRALYLLAGIIDVAAETQSEDLFSSAIQLWEDCVKRQMYVTGGVGQTHHGEAFTFSYDLPNDTVYAETCASIALIFVAQRLLRIKPDASIADVMERALYNTCLASMQQDGTHFFYVNPLAVWPEASDHEPDHWHVKPQRQKWFRCACCPPNLARLISSLGQYIYTIDGDTIYTNLFIQNQFQVTINKGLVNLNIETEYPVDGKVKLIKKGDACTLALRIPSWCESYHLSVDGLHLEPDLTSGYVHIPCPKGDTEITLQFDLKVSRVHCNPSVPENIGSVALQRGPLVYCIEEADNGTELWRYRIPNDAHIREIFKPDLLGGVVALNVQGMKTVSQNSELYSHCEPEEESTPLTFIPYYAWSNRKPGEMRVWLREN